MTGRRGKGEQFQAVPDPHIADRAALAAMITPILANACCPTCEPTAPAAHIRSRSAKAAASRVRAISTARLRRACGEFSSQPRLGRITSAHISTSRPGLNPDNDFPPVPAFTAAGGPDAATANSRQSG